MTGLRTHPRRRNPASPASPASRPRQSAQAPGRHRWPRRLAGLAVALAVLGPALTIGAQLHVNDILSADLLPGTLFLREQQAVNVSEASPAASTAARGADKPRVGNWTDAFLTMNFHRHMMNEYLCRSYVAEQILGDMAAPASMSAAGSGDPASAAALTSSSSLASVTSAPLRRLSNTLVVGGPKTGDPEDPVVLEDDASEGSEERRGLLGRHGGAGRNSPAANDTAPDTAAVLGHLDELEARTTTTRIPDEPRSNLPSFRRKVVVASAASSPTEEGSRRRRRRRRRRRKKKKPGSGPRRASSDVKDALLADEGSSAYKEWLARTTLLEDIYRHYDNIAQASGVPESVMVPHHGGDDTVRFEGGEVTGFAMTHAANSPSPVINPGLSPASFNLPVQHPSLSSLSLSPGLNLASTINSFASPGSIHTAPSPVHSQGVGEDRNPFEYSGGGGEYVDSHEHHEHHEHPEYHEHHEHHEHHEELEKGHHSKMLSLKDLFDLVLTAIAFLAFGAFAIHLIMCLMMIPQQYPGNNNMMMMMEVPPGNDNGAGEGEGGRRRRAAPNPGAATPLLPAVSAEVLNRAAQRVLASIDAATLAYQRPRRKASGRSHEADAEAGGTSVDNRDCLHRALCRHNRFSRTVDGSFRVWMPIWSVGMSWVAGRLSPGTSTPAVATLDNLRASLLGLGNARCGAVFPRCTGPRQPPGTRTDAPTPESTATPLPSATPIPPPLPSSTPMPTSSGSGTVPGTVPGIIHPAFNDLSKIITRRPPRGPATASPGVLASPNTPGTQFTAIGMKSSKNKKRRGGSGSGHSPAPHASARRAQRPRRRPQPTPQAAPQHD